MPFTVSHAAAVIPAARWLRRRGLLSAAVIGCMVPDFAYFLPVRLMRWQTHSLPALFSFCLPVGLSSWLLLQALLKPAVIEVFPDRWYQRLVQEHSRGLPDSLSQWFAVVVALLLGALSHLVWDGFTHESGRGVRLLPEFEDAMVHFAGHDWHVYRLLQHGSSVIGLVLVLGALALWMYRTPRPAQPLPRRLGRIERWCWLAVYCVAPTLVAAAAAAEAWSDGGDILRSADGLTAIAVAGMGSTLGSLIVVSALLRVRLSARLRR
ncbi:MAG TPA: DUF4184 family protein [Steroidobacteraceae bacterium]|nr:DUF4184 family protein [Steroidobacteraceae bacterium]